VDVGIVKEPTISRSPRVRAAAVAGETVLLHLDQARYFTLNSTGGRVWEALETPRTVSELVDAVCASHEVEPARARTEIEALIAELAADRLVEVGP
jgi:hypothetical protein